MIVSECDCWMMRYFGKTRTAWSIYLQDSHPSFGRAPTTRKEFRNSMLGDASVRLTIEYSIAIFWVCMKMESIVLELLRDGSIASWTTFIEARDVGNAQLPFYQAMKLWHDIRWRDVMEDQGNEWKNKSIRCSQYWSYEGFLLSWTSHFGHGLRVWTIFHAEVIYRKALRWWTIMFRPLHNSQMNLDGCNGSFLSLETRVKFYSSDATESE